MSEYTVTLKSICEEISGIISDPNQAISLSRSEIFDFTYPLYTTDDADRKEKLETKILKWFYLREIGLPTMSIWKWQLENRMNDIMPYYNEMYRTAYELIQTRPDAEYSSMRSETTATTTTTGNTSTSSSTTTGSNTDTGSETNTNVSTQSDLPQGQLTDFENNKYLSAASKTTGSTNTSNTGTSSSDYEQNTSATGTGSGNTTFNSTATGHNTNMATLVQKYREEVMNVDMMIIHDLSELFMGVW